ncbi:MAG: ornithine carbamoyltransferase [Oscillospiraceae bacterium]|nr:ornithine carbamoyltransferase [Oscillospiraceae bacterium]
MPVNLKGRSFLTLMDFTPREIRYMLDLAHSLKKKKESGIPGELLRGKNIVLLFEKTSTRTRCAFEVAVHDEGGHVTFLEPGSSQMGKKESMEDTAKVLGRFFDGIEYRGYDQSVVETLAKYSGVPVYNGLTDVDHPTQIIADFMTMEEHISKPLNKCKLVFVGDVRNNMCYALMYGCCKMGVDFVGYGPRELIEGVDQEVFVRVQQEAEKSGASIILTDDREKLIGADAVYTDIWASMGEEEKTPERTRLLTPFRVDEQLMRDLQNPRAIFMHCLPAFHDSGTVLAQQWLEKGVDIREVSDAVFRSRNSVVFDQAENRMHAIKSILVSTL